MNYDHEMINHGCQGTAEYFYTLLHALKLACEHSDSSWEVRRNAFQAETLVVEDLIETLDKFKKPSIWTATITSTVRRTVEVEANSEDEAKRKTEALTERSDEIIEAIGKKEDR